MQKSGANSLKKLIFITLVTISVIFFFIIFIRGNNERATEISVNSLKDATLQTSQRIDEILERAKGELILTSALYEEMQKNSDITDDLAILTEKSPFDYIDFVDTTGQETNVTGIVTDVSQKDYFKDGMAGNSGIAVSFRDEGNIIIFYTPLHSNDEIIGLLIGLYKEEQVESIIYSTFFDENSRTFLCMQDGSIIAGCNDQDSLSKNVFEKDTFHNGLLSGDEEGLREALLNNESYEFEYNGTSGTGNAYCTPLNQSDWLLIQTYPSQVTSRFISTANRAGVILLIELVGVFVTCIVIILVNNAVQRKKLVHENIDKSYVIDGISHIFDRFIMVNLKDNTYKYLADTKPLNENAPTTGDYDELKRSIIGNAKDDDEKKHLGKLLTKESLLKSLDGQNANLRYEYRINHNSQKWNGLNIICLSREDDQPKEVLFAYQDVTLLKNRELLSYEALKEAFQAVESANQAKTTFLSNMSHDIRTPMNGIIGMTAIAGAHINDTERVADCLQKITVSSKHLLGLINEVLDMSKIESGKVDLNEEEFKLSDLIDNLLTMIKPQIEAHEHDLNINIKNVTHEKVIGDSLRIQQVFMNLMSNAVKYTPNGGKINLTISEKPTHQQKSGFYEIIIQDNGIGMTEEFVQKVFEPFVRSDDERVTKMQGTGLGMPIARNIVRMMGGDIIVESKLNEGTKFIVTFFLKLQDSHEVSYEDFIDLPVLVADDDQVSCECTCNILDEIGMKGEWVLSGKEAFERVLERHVQNDQFFAVILDWKMDEMDGIATAKAIRQEVGDDVPIIILSAYDWSEIEQEARRVGVNAFISKPLFKSRIVSLFNRLLGHTKENLEERTTPLSSLESINLSNKRVLLVEDNELNIEIATEILKTTGIKVDFVTNGAEAVDRIMAIPDGYYDLVLMDIQMPVMNGYEATRAIRSMDREYTKGLPIIAMTANAFAEDVHMAKGAGMNAHISKPLDLDIFADILRKWVL